MYRKYLKLKCSTYFVGLVREKTNFQLKLQRSTTEIIKDKGDHAWSVLDKYIFGKNTSSKQFLIHEKCQKKLKSKVGKTFL